MALSSRDHFLPNVLAVYLNKKGKCLSHTHKQKYRHNSLTSSRPWHALHCLLWICNSDSPTTRFSTKKRFFFCILSIFTRFKQICSASFFPAAVYTLRFSTVCVVFHPTPKSRLLGYTSWKTRHLVFSHIMSENGCSSPSVHSRNVQLLPFTKMWPWKRGSANPSQLSSFLLSHWSFLLSVMAEV